MQQTIRANTLDKHSSFDSKAFREALGHFPTGVAVITTRTEMGEDLGMTVSSFNSVSLKPALVLFCIDRRAHGLALWQKAHAFGINVLAEGQDALSNQFAKASANKWENLEVSRGIDEVPLLKGAIVTFEAHAWGQHEGGDHVIFICEVQRFTIHRYPGPLVFSQGRYNHLRPGALAPDEWPLAIHY